MNKFDYTVVDPATVLEEQENGTSSGRLIHPEMTG